MQNELPPGTVREDGFILVKYRKMRDGTRRAEWESPERRVRRLEVKTAVRRNYQARLRSTEEGLAKARKWSREAASKYRIKNPVRQRLQHIKARCSRRGVEFSLKEEDIVVPDVCPVFGFPIGNHYGPCHDQLFEIDRIKQDQGYHKGNVIVVSRLANRLKSNASVAQLRMLADFYEKLERTLL
jgi:hypothetical protein